MQKNDKCPYCKNGVIPEYTHIQSGRCFACDGKGVLPVGSTFAFKTDQELETERLEYWEDKRKEHNSEFDSVIKSDGFYFPLVKNTFKVKDRLRELGFKYMPEWGWYTTIIPIDKKIGEFYTGKAYLETALIERNGFYHPDNIVDEIKDFTKMRLAELQEQSWV